MNNWDEFYNNVMELEPIKKLSEWSKLNDVIFEPYARDADTNELKCTCCYFGDVVDDKDYIVIKIGDNGAFEKTQCVVVVEHDEDGEDIEYEGQVEKSFEEMLYDYKNLLKDEFVAFRLSPGKLDDFCKTMNFEMPKGNDCISTNNIKPEEEME